MKKSLGFTYLGLVALTVLFHIAIALGAPLGSFTQGGTVSGQLGAAGRVTAAVSALILVLFALVVVRKAEILPAKGHPKFVNFVFWIVLVFSALETLLNWITPSDLERLVWGPVNTVLLVCVIGIAKLSRRK